MALKECGGATLPRGFAASIDVFFQLHATWIEGPSFPPLTIARSFDSLNGEPSLGQLALLTRLASQPCPPSARPARPACIHVAHAPCSCHGTTACVDRALSGSIVPATAQRVQPSHALTADRSCLPIAHLLAASVICRRYRNTACSEACGCCAWLKRCDAHAAHMRSMAALENGSGHLTLKLTLSAMPSTQSPCPLPFLIQADINNIAPLWIKLARTC